MQEALSKLKSINKSGAIIYLPAYLVKDSNFPFKKNKDVVVLIRGKRLLIEPVGFVPANQL